MDNPVTLINRFGRAVVTPATLVDDAVRNGCRYPDSTDWRELNSTRASFRLPRIEPMIEHRGLNPIVVFGAGPSCDAHIDNAYRLGVNVRPNGPEYDAVLALDEVYWREMWEPRDGTHAFVKYTCEGPEGTSKNWRGRVGVSRYWLPVHPLKSQQERHETKAKHELVMAVKGAITSVHISGIAAILLARQLTDGPVIIAGFDLSADYTFGQARLFKAASQALEGVYCHKAMDGPLRDVFPTFGYEDGVYSMMREATCGVA